MDEVETIEGCVVIPHHRLFYFFTGPMATGVMFLWDTTK